MRNETPNELLDNRIKELKIKREQQLNELKQQFEFTCDKLKPINLAKDALHEITQSPDIRDGIGSAAIGFTSGYLVKKLLFKASNNPIKNLANIAVQSIVANVTAKHSDVITNTGFKLVQLLVSKLTKPQKHISEHDITV